MNGECPRLRRIPKTCTKIAVFRRILSGKWGRFSDMTSNMILVVTLIYAATAVSFLTDKNPGMALCFLGYVIANLGIVWSLR